MHVNDDCGVVLTQQKSRWYVLFRVVVVVFSFCDFLTNNNSIMIEEEWGTRLKLSSEGPLTDFSSTCADTDTKNTDDKEVAIG